MAQTSYGKEGSEKNWEITKKAKYLRRKDEHTLAEPLKAQSVDGETWEKHKQTMRILWRHMEAPEKQKA